MDVSGIAVQTLRDRRIQALRKSLGLSAQEFDVLALIKRAYLSLSLI